MIQENIKMQLKTNRGSNKKMNDAENRPTAHGNVAIYEIEIHGTPNKKTFSTSKADLYYIQYTWNTGLLEKK